VLTAIGNGLLIRLGFALWCGLDSVLRCDHFGGHGHGGGSGDPVLDAITAVFVVSAMILIAGSVGISLIGGSLLMFFTNQIRQLFWAVPGANGLLYFLVLLLRPYPGGFYAQFRLPGLVYTIVEIVGLLLLTILLLIVLILGRFLFRGIQSAHRWKANLSAASCSEEAQPREIK
jgi:hypothetical protein